MTMMMRMVVMVVVMRRESAATMGRRTGHRTLSSVGPLLYTHNGSTHTQYMHDRQTDRQTDGTAAAAAAAATTAQM